MSDDPHEFDDPGEIKHKPGESTVQFLYGILRAVGLFGLGVIVPMVIALTMWVFTEHGDVTASELSALGLLFNFLALSGIALIAWSVVELFDAFRHVRGVYRDGVVAVRLMRGALP